MLVNLAELRSDVTWREVEIRKRLASKIEVDDDVQDACGYFERNLIAVLESTDESSPWRHWCTDTLWCESLRRSGSVVTLVGEASWLDGGDRCDRFTIDVALDTDPLLYSYKLSNAKTGDQVLYVGRTPDGWKLSG